MSYFADEVSPFMSTLNDTSNVTSDNASNTSQTSSGVTYFGISSSQVYVIIIIILVIFIIYTSPLGQYCFSNLGSDDSYDTRDDIDCNDDDYVKRKIDRLNAMQDNA